MEKRIIISVLVGTLVIASVVQAKNKEPVLNKKKICIQVGERYQLKVKSNRKKKVKWSSAKKKIATVSKKGVVTARKTGTAKIRAKIGKKTLTCKVTVKNADTPKPGDKATPTPKPGDKTTPTPNGDSLVTKPTEDPNGRDEGWVPGWY